MGVIRCCYLNAKDREGMKDERKITRICEYGAND